MLWAGESRSFFWKGFGDKMEFPRLVYKSASLHLLVEDEDGFLTALEDGWFSTVPEAINPQSKPVEEQKPVEQPKQEEPPYIKQPTLTLKGKK